MEIARQIFHIVFGLVLVSLLYYNFLNKEILFWILILGIFISLICLKFKLFVLDWFLKLFDRENAIIPGQGALTFVAGSLIVLFLFSKEVALGSIMVLTLGDSFCHIPGRIKHPFNNVKFIEGVLIGAIIAGIGASFFVPVIKAFLGSLVAMIIESFDLKFSGRNIDDNLFIPLIAGIVFYFS